jgi:hypothetical protein
MGHITVNTITLNSLPYADGASWDPSRVCLSGTRVNIIDDMWAWANSIENSNGAQIFWLVDVAGAGKSAIGLFLSKYYRALLSLILIIHSTYLCPAMS